MGARVLTASEIQAHEKLGQILLKSTSLSERQLEEALAIQKMEGGLLGEILVQKNYISTHEILKALCSQLGIEFLEDLNPSQIDPNLVTGIPINYTKNKEFIPILKKTASDDESISVLVVAVSDPFNDQISNDLQLITGCRIEYVVSTGLRIQDAINLIYEKNTSNIVDNIEGEFQENLDLDGPIDILEATEDDAPVIKFVNSLLFRAVKEGTSDIHIEPFEKDFVTRFRVDGVLKDIIRQPKAAHAAIASRIKVMGSLDIAEKRLPQDGRIKIKIAGKDIDIRLSTVPTIHGERIVMRLLEQTGRILQLAELGFSKESVELVEKLIFKKHGIVLVTGPTGHGKSTTLSACLSRLNSPERNILTVEDPIEYQIQGVNQVQVNAKIELTFARALRAFLRQNPDVIMVGEIRDKETAEIAINASLTGHLVLSTLHTNDAAGVPTRLIDMGVEPFLISSSLLGIVAQRLIRRVCSKCKTPYDPPKVDLEALGLKKLPQGVNIFKAVGCHECSNTGYAGRTVIHELLVISDEVRAQIVARNDASLIKKTALKEGMVSLRDDGVRKVLEGLTTVEELTRATHSEG